MRTPRWFLLLIASLLVFAGCGESHERAELVFINGAEPETLDPALITGQPEMRVASSLFEGLTRFNAKGEAIPGMAERWEVSANGTVYRFFIRQNAKWSNGDPVTAHDFVASWRRTLAPETGADYATQFYFIHNAQPFNEGKLTDFSQVGIRAIDDHTLEVTLNASTPFFLDLCAFIALSPVHIPTVEKFGDDWTKPAHIVTNGPYLLKVWRLNDRIRLEKNPNYWDAAHVGMNTIDALPIHNANTAFNFYATGLADLTLDKGVLPTHLLDVLRKRPDFHTAPFLGTYFIRFNTTRPPFNDARVRKAFALVIDKEAIVEKITRLGEPPAAGMVPPGAGGGYHPPDGLARDPEEARRLLAEAGYPDGKGFPLIHYLYSEGGLNRDIAVELQTMLKRELGITMSLQPQEWKVYLSSMNSLAYDLCRSSWVADYNDPNTFLSLFTSTDGNNRTGWADAKYDQLIAAAGQEQDEAKRFELFKQAERRLVEEELPVCPLYFYIGTQLYDGERLGGVEPNLVDEHPLREMYWKKP